MKVRAWPQTRDARLPRRSYGKRSPYSAIVRSSFSWRSTSRLPIITTVVPSTHCSNVNTRNAPSTASIAPIITSFGKYGTGRG